MSIVAHTAAAPGANGGTTSAIDTSGATGIYVHISEYLGASGFSLSDSKGNTWTPRTQYSSGSVSRTRIYYCENPTVGSGHTFTYSGSGGYPTICVEAHSGTKTSSSYDQENGATNTATNSLQPGSITPTENNELIISGAAQYIEAAISNVDSGFTVSDGIGAVSGTNVGGTMAYLYQGAAAAINPTWTFGTTVDAAVVQASFKTPPASTNTSLFFMGAGAS